MPITIYHNPNCGTSRTVLAAIRAAGHEPTIVEYLKTPLSRDEIEALSERLQIPLRDMVRSKEALFAELGLGAPGVGEEELLDAMAAHPILLNRPIVVTPAGARLCRPAETVNDLLAKI
ncbi:MAG TPA: arsenate reductase (glutaredoxin) [Rhizomicrobium sp.]|jgi:arsenate reductase|nr:arsenate reductase (glutaredoxin) [Rhizomicrobium sp.]